MSVHEHLGGASFPYLQARVCAPLTRLPTGIHGGAKSSACISRVPLSDACAAVPPLAVRSHSPHVAACLSMAHTRQGCSATPAIRSPQPFRAQHPGHLPSDIPTAQAAPAPPPRSRRERSNCSLCSEWMTSAHIGNSTVPGSRCDLPVAHLLASVKCKSLRAPVSAQYSQEHEGSCAKGRVRAGRQQGALFPPLSGVDGLKKSAYSRGFAGAVSSPHPP